MSTKLTEGEPRGLEEGPVVTTSVLGRRLSPEQFRRVTETMQKLAIDFLAAAQHLGFLTEQEIKHAGSLIDAAAAEDVPGLIEMAVRRLSTSRALVAKQGAPVRPGSRIVLAQDPYGLHSEKIRALRTEILLRCPSTDKANVIAVLSASTGEGRSQLAAEIALAFAQLGGRTLLIDADFRNPRQHVLFDCGNEEGLSHAVVRQEPSFLNPVEGVPSMALLTTGPVPPNPLELLSDGRFGKCMQRWRDRYQFVIIDTPPITRCADGLAVAAIAGRALLLSRARHTSYKDTKEMMRRLASTQAQILGAVVNHY